MKFVLHHFISEHGSSGGILFDPIRPCASDKVVE